MSTSVKKPAAKKASKKVEAPAPGVKGTDVKKIKIAVVMEVRHRILPFVWHTHHMVSVMDIEEDKQEMTERAARVAAKMASKHIPGVKCRVVCVEEVGNSMGLGLEGLKKALAS